ncbi:hypothetical protein [Tistrella sp.]|nr:hypothetical protein [Tistrella sp.]
MASAHPGRRIDGTDPKRQAEHDDRSLDRALQDLYAAYGDDTSPPEELMALAREAAAALADAAGQDGGAAMPSEPADPGVLNRTGGSDEHTS